VPDIDIERRDLAAIGRDPELFERFYRTHVDMVGRFIARRVSDPHTVADLTADVFLAAIASAHSYRPERGSVAGWIHGVARHVVAGEFKRRAREHDAAQRAGGRRVLGTEDIARIEERIDAEKSARRTYEALTAMPEPVRELIELIAVDGLTVAQAAAALGVTPLVARVRLHRARKVLRGITAQPLSTPALTII
jgi:RNA polymerase sigma-70 factor (ECF subfamily)